MILILSRWDIEVALERYIKGEFKLDMDLTDTQLDMNNVTLLPNYKTKDDEKNFSLVDGVFGPETSLNIDIL